MSKQHIGGLITGILVVISLLSACVDTNWLDQWTSLTLPASLNATLIVAQIAASSVPSFTPTNTLRPPPTFEPPTATLAPSNTPTITPTATLLLNIAPPPGLRGYPSPTVTAEVITGCQKRDDWELRYTVKPGDALSNIAAQYGTFTNELVKANCLEDANVIISGQVLRVPGDAQAEAQKYVCTDWEALTPFNGAYTVAGDQNLTFNWRGPVAERYLVRVIMPSGKIWEQLVDRQQNLVVYLPEVLPEEGNHIWYVYPLGLDFLQIPCHEGGPWNFHKSQSPALTWTPTATATVTDTP